MFYIVLKLINQSHVYKSCSVAPGVAVPPWATETVLSPWLAADEARVSHVLPHVVWWKKKKKIKREWKGFEREWMIVMVVLCSMILVIYSAKYNFLKQVILSSWDNISGIFLSQI